MSVREVEDGKDKGGIWGGMKKKNRERKDEMV